jgi:hypothetical protein
MKPDGICGHDSMIVVHKLFCTQLLVVKDRSRVSVLAAASTPPASLAARTVGIPAVQYLPVNTINPFCFELFHRIVETAGS